MVTRPVGLLLGTFMPRLTSVELRLWIMNEPTAGVIIKTVLSYYPAVQGIYLFGSFGTEDEWPDSDIDIALLMPPEQAKQENFPSRTNFS